jgi:hypothetical protein
MSLSDLGPGKYEPKKEATMKRSPVTSFGTGSKAPNKSIKGYMESFINKVLQDHNNPIG